MEASSDSSDALRNIVLQRILGDESSEEDGTPAGKKRNYPSERRKAEVVPPEDKLVVPTQCVWYKHYHHPTTRDATSYYGKLFRCRFRVPWHRVGWIKLQLRTHGWKGASEVHSRG